MPVSLKRIREGGTGVFLHTCEACGLPAGFGYDVSMLDAMERLSAGDKVAAKARLGRWYCGEHRPEAAGDVGA